MAVFAGMREAVMRTVTLNYLQAMSARHAGRYPRMAIFSFDFIGHQINVFGRYEKEQLETLARLLGERDGIALDIGANIGNHSLFLADLFSEVHAFEPNPAILPLLRYNLADRANAQVYAFGASRRDEMIEARIPLRNIGGGSVAGPREAGEDRTVTFELKRLDRLPELSAKRIAFVKLDVEGHEAAAIDGLAGILERDGPLVALEQNPDEISAGSSAAVDRLRALGYDHLYEIAPARSRISQAIPRFLRAPLRLLEAGFASQRRGPSFAAVTRLEQRAYPMLLASRGPLLPPGSPRR